MGMKKTIVILGGGIGGIVTARELRKNLGNQHRIILVDEQPVYAFAPSFLWIMIGWRTPEIIQKSLSLLEKYGIEFRQAIVEEISVEEKTVRTNHGALEYDYLVIALGADIVPQIIPGLVESSLTFYSLAGAIEMYGMLKEFSGSRVAIVISDLPYKCPPAPYEAAFLLESFFSRRGDSGKKIEIYIPDALPIGVAGQVAGMRIASMLRERGISLAPNKKLVSVDKPGKRMLFGDGTSFEFDMLIAVPPHRVPPVIQRARLTDTSGWIPVDPKIMRTEFPGIFAIGDVTTIPAQNGLSLPKAGVIAANQAEVVASVIACEINQHGFRKEFTGTGFCFIETGNGRAGYIGGNFFSESSPGVILHEPNVTYHWGKVVFEKYWLWRWF
jgi:sulfide:quinone oxidoreductase